MRLAAVFAHPDDDAFGIFGTLALHATDGLEAMTVLATRGEAGSIADPSLATRDNLGQVREIEAQRAYAALGFPGLPLHFLGYPDGGVADAPRDELVDRVTNLLAGFGPDVVVTFGPEGITKHDDHVAMHHVATESFRRARDQSGTSGPARLLYVAIPQSRIDMFQQMQREAGKEPFNPEGPFQPRGVPDDTIAVTVDCSGVWRRKYDALREHRTQAEEIDDLPEVALPIIFGEEHFVQAWPKRGRDAARLRDVFEGLELGKDSAAG